MIKPLTHKMESLILVITFVSFLIPIVNTVINPHPFQIEATIHAKAKGWNDRIILITRSCCYLTLYTQFWTMIAMYKLTPTTMFIAQSLSCFVFCLYHGINYLDTKHLSYHSQELVKEVVSLKPPKNEKAFIWFGLHWQHTIFPFYLTYLSYKHSINYQSNVAMMIYSFLVMGLYVVWHLFCWHVQGIAAYPFLNKLRTTSHELSFYYVSFILTIIINSMIASMWSELFFYIMGFLSMLVIVFKI